MLPKNSPNISPIVTVEISQLRERNTERSRIGSSSVSSQIIRAISATAATIAAQTMKEDENQSSSRPLSTITWQAHRKAVRSSSQTTQNRLGALGAQRVGSSAGRLGGQERDRTLRSWRSTDH